MAAICVSHHCDQCKNPTSDLFYCTTCDLSHKVETSSEKELLCDICIASHVIRSHEITDKKGTEPLICQEHKMLEQEYCRTCDTTFCWKCMSKHSEHKFSKLDKRGSELRTEVFELLSELEIGEKPLRVKKEKFSEVIEKHKKQQSNLLQLIETEIEKLRKTCLTVIGENCEMASINFENVTQLVDETVDMQKKLRNLLSSSKAHLLKQFAETQNQVLDHNVAQMELTEKGDLVVEACQMEDIPAMFEIFGQNLKNFMKSTQKTEKASIDLKLKYRHSQSNEVILNGRSGIVHKIVVSNGLLRIEYADVRKLGTSESELKFYGKEEMDFSEKVDRCFILYNFAKASNRILLISGAKNHYKIEILAESKLSRISSPPYKHLLCPYTFPSSDYEKIVCQCCVCFLGIFQIFERISWSNDKKIVKCCI